MTVNMLSLEGRLQLMWRLGDQKRAVSFSPMWTLLRDGTWRESFIVWVWI